jgi:hypothetical protein
MCKTRKSAPPPLFSTGTANCLRQKAQKDPCLQILPGFLDQTKWAMREAVQEPRVDLGVNLDEIEFIKREAGNKQKVTIVYLEM